METKLDITNKLLLFIASLFLVAVQAWSEPDTDEQKQMSSILEENLIALRKEIYGN